MCKAEDVGPQSSRVVHVVLRLCLHGLVNIPRRRLVPNEQVHSVA